MHSIIINHLIRERYYFVTSNILLLYHYIQYSYLQSKKINEEEIEIKEKNIYLRFEK
jgi:hypothetical protein